MGSVVEQGRNLAEQVAVGSYPHHTVVRWASGCHRHDLELRTEQTMVDVEVPQGRTSHRDYGLLADPRKHCALWCPLALTVGFDGEEKEQRTLAPEVCLSYQVPALMLQPGDLLNTLLFFALHLCIDAGSRV